MPPGRRLTITGADYSANLIIGQTGIAGGDMAYARMADNEASYLIRAKLDLPDDRNGWVDSRLFDIASSEVRAVRIEHPDGEVLALEKAGADATDFERTGYSRWPGTYLRGCRQLHRRRARRPQFRQRGCLPGTRRGQRRRRYWRASKPSTA